MNLDQIRLEKPLIQILCYQQVEEDDDELCCTVDRDASHLSFEESTFRIVDIAPTYL